MITIVRKALNRAIRPLLRSGPGIAVFKWIRRGREHFVCPLCHYMGPFVTIRPVYGRREHACCPQCGSAERTRLQYLVLRRMDQTHDLSRMSAIHFAPERHLQHHFRRLFGKYVSADLQARNVDYQVDLRDLPFDDASYDFVFASHVLEHIKEDLLALSEISRILRRGSSDDRSPCLVHLDRG